MEHPNWLNALNTASCLLLLGYLLLAAAQATRWRHRITLIPLTLVVGLQAFDPLAAWVPSLAWPSVAMNAALVFTVTIYRRELWHPIRAKFDPVNVPLERKTDYLEGTTT